MPERVKLKITEVGEPKEVGSKGAKKLTFKAKGADNKELSYFTFRPTLFDLIKTGAEIDAEVDTKTREYDGNTYTDRQVNQIFVDGQPIGGEKKQWQGSKGKSPEERQSIERQVAVKAVVELVACGAIPQKHPLFGAVLDWCWDKLLPNAVKPTPKTAPTPTPATPQAPNKPMTGRGGSNPSATAQDKPPEDRLLTKEEFSKLYKLMADFQMEIKALGNWMREKEIPVPLSLKQMPKSTYDKIMAGFEED